MYFTVCDAGSPHSASSTTVLTHVSPVLRISKRREQCNSNHVTGIGEISVTIRSLDRNITWSIQITHLCCCNHWDKSPGSVPFRSMYRGNTRCHMEFPPLLWRGDNRLCRFWKGKVNQKTNDMVSEELQMRQPQRLESTLPTTQEQKHTSNHMQWPLPRFVLERTCMCSHFDSTCMSHSLHPTLFRKHR